MNKKGLRYDGLGFPVLLRNVEVRLVMGEEQPVINHLELEAKAFETLMLSTNRLTGAQLCFVRGHMKKTQREFAKMLGLSGHGRVSQWESQKNAAAIKNPAQELIVRMYMAQHINQIDHIAVNFESFLTKLQPAVAKMVIDAA